MGDQQSQTPEPSHFWDYVAGANGTNADAAGLGSSVLEGSLHHAILGDGMKDAEMLERYTAGEAGGVSLLGGLGTGLSALSMIDGAHTMLDAKATTGQRALGGVNAAIGAVGTAGGLAEMGGVSTGFLGGLSAVGGAGGLGADAMAASTWGAGAAGGAAAGTALATGAAVAGAGLAGYGIGNYGKGQAAQRGWYGHNANGSNRDASDMASDWGIAAQEAVGHGALGTAAGLGAVAAGSVVGAGEAVGGAVLGAGEAIGYAGREIWDWL